MGDHHVDRRQVQGARALQPSRTKGPCGLIGPTWREHVSRTGPPTCRTRVGPRAFPTHTPDFDPCPGLCTAGGYGAGDPPDPIPNSEVKTRCADGTAGATRWESTAPPANLDSNARFDHPIEAGVAVGASRALVAGETRTRPTASAALGSRLAVACPLQLREGCAPDRAGNPPRVRRC